MKARYPGLCFYVQDVRYAAGAGMRRTLTGRKWLKAYGTSFPAARQDQLIYIFVNIHK